MANIICYANGKYNIYTTISDGFYWNGGLTIEQLANWYEYKHGRSAMDGFAVRVERAKETGSSSMVGRTLKEVISCNRAGDNEEHLTYEECVDRFFS